MNDRITCPLEKKIAESLDQAGIKYLHEQEGSLHLDFYLPEYDVYLEIKNFYSSRISKQMKRANSVIAIQGKDSVDFIVKLLKNKL